MMIENQYDDDVLGEFMENSSQEDGILLYVNCSSTKVNWSKARNLHKCMMLGRHYNITVILDLTQNVPTEFLVQIDCLFVFPFTEYERSVLVRKMVGIEYTNEEIVKMAKTNNNDVLLFNLYKVHEKNIVEFYRI